MDENLVIVAALFSMSLLGAFVLFRWLHNSAMVKTPIGEFGS